MGNIVSQPVRYLPANRFRVTFDGESYGEFAECEGFDEFEIGVLELHTGDSNVVAAQQAGKKRSSNLKLSRGAVPYGNDLLRQWCELVVDSSGVNGEPDPAYMKSGLVEQLDRDGTPVMSWPLMNAFPVRYSGGKFDAKSNEYRMVSVEITSAERFTARDAE